MKKLLMPAIIAAALISPIAPAAAGSTDNVVITLTSAEQQARGMAMVLANAMQAKGAHVSVLLCDSAGDMALKEHQSTPLKPKNVTPEQLLQKLMSGGARVDVCALYLPNKGVGMEALKEGVGSAKPATMAEALMAEGTRVFNF